MTAKKMQMTQRTMLKNQSQQKPLPKTRRPPITMLTMVWLLRCTKWLVTMFLQKRFQDLRLGYLRKRDGLQQKRDKPCWFWLADSRQNATKVTPRKLVEPRNLLPFLERIQYQSEILEVVVQLVLIPFWNLRKLHGRIHLRVLSLMEDRLGLELFWAICLEELRRLKWLGQVVHMGCTKVATKEGFLMQMQGTMLGELLSPQLLLLVVQPL
mmetsp:Transcript_17158/g.37027  ORF Transcript_17158/g.37027 Transcript_17158/m.37027 type:complete len:211 (+) Transcript_17158:4987-5619(+)